MEPTYLSGENPIRVLLLGTGQMGAGITGLLRTRQGLKLVGAYGRRAHRAGMDLGQAVGLEQKLGIPISNNLTMLIEQCRPDVAIQATCSKIVDAADEIRTLVQHSVHVVSIAEEMAYPACSAPAFAKEIHDLALSRKVGVVGTGINPGFVLDLLVLTLTGVCADVQSITAQRVNDLSPYGPSVLASQGVGLDLEQFHQGLAEGTVAGHFGFPQSIHMIADVLGWQLDDIQESREPIVSTVRRTTPFVTVEKGQVAGCFHQAMALRQGVPVITLIHPQQIHPHLEGVTTADTIEIDGSPKLRLSLSPEIPGGTATCSLAVNTIPRLLGAGPGLLCMADLPVVAAMAGSRRDLIRVNVQEARYG